MEILEEAGLPAGVINLVPGSGGEVREIIDKVNEVLDGALKTLREVYEGAGIRFLDGGDANTID